MIPLEMNNEVVTASDIENSPSPTRQNKRRCLRGVDQARGGLTWFVRKFFLKPLGVPVGDITDPRLAKAVDMMALSTLYIIGKCIVAVVLEFVTGWYTAGVLLLIWAILVPLSGVLAVKWQNYGIGICFLVLNLEAFLVSCGLWIYFTIRILQRGMKLEAGLEWFIDYQKDHFGFSTFFNFATTFVLIAAFLINSIEAAGFVKLLRERADREVVELQAANGSLVSRLREEEQKARDVSTRLYRMQSDALLERKVRCDNCCSRDGMESRSGRAAEFRSPEEWSSALMD